MMLILAYDSYFEKKDSQVILVKKCPKDSQPLRIMILIKKKMSVVPMMSHCYCDVVDFVV